MLVLVYVGEGVLDLSSNLGLVLPMLLAALPVLGAARESADLGSIVFPVSVAPLGLAGQDTPTPLGTTQPRPPPLGTHSGYKWHSFAA